MLYQINYLRVAVEMAKRLLTKEQMEKRQDSPLPVHLYKSIRVTPETKIKWKRKYPLVL